MTRLTEQYLLNYLQKKSLTMAALQEDAEASSILHRHERMKGLLSTECQTLGKLRKGHALAFVDRCQVDEAAAFDAYMTHLQEVS